jgi:hypothetical protein
MSSRVCPAPSSKALRLRASAFFAGAVLLASPLRPALAQSPSAMSSRADAAVSHEDTIDQRISSLHAELKITPAEESDWQAVATTMRDNAAAMDKLAPDKAASAKTMTAIEDLQTYQQFAQAHVEHLKKLTAAFETLYNAMPAEQKKIADEVFERSHHDDDRGQG